MGATDPSRRRSVPVRLSEIPIDVRLRAARAEAKHAKTDAERASLIAAALCPSDQVFYIADDDDHAAAA